MNDGVFANLYVVADINPGNIFWIITDGTVFANIYKKHLEHIIAHFGRRMNVNRLCTLTSCCVFICWYLSNSTAKSTVASEMDERGASRTASIPGLYLRLQRKRRVLYKNLRISDLPGEARWFACASSIFPNADTVASALPYSPVYHQGYLGCAELLYSLALSFLDSVKFRPVLLAGWSAHYLR